MSMFGCRLRRQPIRAWISTTPAGGRRGSGDVRASLMGWPGAGESLSAQSTMSRPRPYRTRRTSENRRLPRRSSGALQCPPPVPRPSSARKRQPAGARAVGGAAVPEGAARMRSALSRGPNHDEGRVFAPSRSRARYGVLLRYLRLLEICPAERAGKQRDDPCRNSCNVTRADHMS
jgi:hypothetical protein